MDYLLDTNAVSDLMREDSKATTRAAKIGTADRLIVCLVVRGEILYGIRRLAPGRRRDVLELKANKIVAAAATEPIPMDAAEQYANLKIARERQGLSLDENDLWIAA